GSTPAAARRLVSGRAGPSAGAVRSVEGVSGSAFGGVGVFREGPRLPPRMLVRLATGRSLRRAGFALGLSVGSQDLIGSVATSSGDLGHIDALSLYGVSTRRLTR